MPWKMIDDRYRAFYSKILTQHSKRTENTKPPEQTGQREQIEPLAQAEQLTQLIQSATEMYGKAMRDQLNYCTNSIQTATSSPSTPAQEQPIEEHSNDINHIVINNLMQRQIAVLGQAVSAQSLFCQLQSNLHALEKQQI